MTVELLDRDPRLREVVVFETAHDAQLRSVNNILRIHTWGEEECCLPAGTTEAYLFAVPNATAQRPVLQAGGHLILQEVLGARTGSPADADPEHRVLVELAEVDDTPTDPLYSRAILAGGALQLRGPGDQALPLTRVRWRRADQLAAPLCVSARLDDGSLARNVSVACGNVILADHGLTTTEPHDPADIGVDGRLVLRYGPLTLEQRPPLPAVSLTTGRFEVDRGDLAGDVRSALPALTLLVDDSGGARHAWTSVPDLLDSGPFDEQFVAEVDDEGRAGLRFGDGEYGRALGDDATALTAVYRVGNGRAGNVGRDTLTTLAFAGVPGFVDEVRNPLAASGGADAETVEQVRRRAPQAMRAELKRAVTEADWVRAAEQLDGVSGAVATFRWTGSWLTIFVAVDPVDRANLVDLPDGRTRLEPAFERQHPRVADALSHRRPRHRAAAAALRRARARRRAVRAARLLPHRRAQRRPRRALGARAPRRRPRLLPPRQLHVRRPGPRQPAVRRDRARDRRRLRRDPPAHALRPAAARRARSRRAPDRAVGDRAARRRPQLRRARRADRDGARGQGMSCGCCEPTAGLTPLTVENRAGLSAIAYRVGTYSSFRATMLERIAPVPELAGLTTREDDDPSITVLSLWAAVADVLSFYQERYANEAFLRTATQRASVGRLARADRLPAAARRRRARVARVRRRGRRGAARPARAARAERARPGRAAADVRDARRAARRWRR